METKKLQEKLESSKAPDFIKKIDYKLLREQKLVLLENLDRLSNNTELVDAIEGIVNLLDSLQDYVADDLKIGSKFVFDLPNDES